MIRVVLWVCLLVPALGYYCNSYDPKPEKGLRHSGVAYREYYSVGETVNCGCDDGYHVLEPGGQCTLMCTDRGQRWEYGHRCVPMKCPSPPEIENGHLVNITDPGQEWDTSTRARYACAEGYHLTSGAGWVGCYHRDDRGTRWPDSQYLPKCVDCGQPPAISGATLVSNNSTTEFSTAEYTCDDGMIMLGDGVAQCRIKSLGDEPDGYSGRKKMQWVYRPRCVPASCMMPDKPGGQSGPVRVGVRRCTSVAESSFPRVTCEETVEHLLHRNTQVENMLYNGRFVCMVQQITREEVEDTTREGDRERGHPSRRTSHRVVSSASGQECLSQCLSELGQTADISSRESTLYKDGVVFVTREFNRYQILGSPRV